MSNASNTDFNIKSTLVGNKIFSVLQSGQGPSGPRGLSAYQIAVQEGFTGTQTQWVQSLVGRDGSNGVDGNANIWTSDIPPVDTNKYKLWFDSSSLRLKVFYSVGDVSAFIDAIPAGQKGEQGVQGPAGPTGANGLSAYQVAIANGFVGTESSWLESLRATVDSIDGGIF